MTRPEARQAQDTESSMKDYIRQTAGTPSTADEIAKLADLHSKGVITDQEFTQHKAKLLV